MGINYYEHQVVVAQNLKLFMNQKGYTRSSLSKLTGVTAVDQLLLKKGENLDKQLYNGYVIMINDVFSLEEDYFIRPILDQSSELATTTPSITPTERSEIAEELLFGLNHMLEIYSMFIEE